MEKYNHKEIETKQQKKWWKEDIDKVSNDPAKPKCYILDMFPYPSGEGLHVGHPKGYIATDIYSRFKKMQGHNVLHPMGWDAFGLPAENYALKNKIHPRLAVEQNIKNFKNQLKKIGFNYDWEREINTTDPEYYKWTQWIFLKLYEKGLAYQSHEPINWCPSCQTGLANEDLENGRCERCGSEIEQKLLRQWVLKITAYADRLLEDLDSKNLNWPEPIKELQRDWIGRSEGVEINFPLPAFSFQKELKIFTTRPDTIAGVTFMAVSPAVAQLWLTAGWQSDKEVEKYITETLKSRRRQTYKDNPEKTGVFSGLDAVNPANGGLIPIWITNYVLDNVGTGAIMGVPAHDERDFEFANKFNLPVSSAPLIDKDEAIKKINGQKTVRYKLRDWVFSRQRYWGEPIPIIHCEKCGPQPLSEADLPLKLPEVEHYEPTGTGESPLANITEWINVPCPKCGGPAKRETNTMPQWAGSCWYYLRYLDNKNDQVLVAEEKEKYWSPVDVYVGGAEHATRHLIYARFWHKFLFDLGITSQSEPFKELHNVGLILAADGRKMSKRYNNVVNPDDLVNLYGADSLRLYEMFLGPFSDEIVWQTSGIIGVRRFLEKIWRLKEKISDSASNHESIQATIKKVTADIVTFHFNTAISALMIQVRVLEKQDRVAKNDFETLLCLLAPFAPHLTDELWQQLGHQESIHLAKWPEYDITKTGQTLAVITVQINGKFRCRVQLAFGADASAVEAEALAQPEINRWLATGFKRVIFVKDRTINFLT